MASYPFGKLLRKLREDAGLTQSELAESAGLHPSHLNRIESGERTPPKRKNVIRLAKALRLDTYQASELFLGAGYAPLSPKEIARLGLTEPIGPPQGVSSILRVSPFPSHIFGKQVDQQLIGQLKASRLLEAARELYEDKELAPAARDKIDEMGAQFIRWLLQNMRTVDRGADRA